MDLQLNHNNNPVSIPESVTDKLDSFVSSVLIPSESAYYAAEYVRLQSEIDTWKEEATKYKLENEELKKEVDRKTELVDKLTKEKTEQCSGFQLGLDQLKRDNAKLTSTLKKYGAANKLYIEKYKRLKLEHEKTKRAGIALKIARETEKKIQHKNTIYWKNLQCVATFLNECNRHLERHIKNLYGEAVDLSSIVSQFTSGSLQEVDSSLEINIKTISAQIDLITKHNMNFSFGNTNFVQNSNYQCSSQNNCCRTSNNQPLSIATNHQYQAISASVASIATTIPTSSTYHLTPPEAGNDSGYRPSTSPITPDEVEFDRLQRSWAGGHVFLNMM